MCDFSNMNANKMLSEVYCVAAKTQNELNGPVLGCISRQTSERATMTLQAGTQWHSICNCSDIYLQFHQSFIANDMITRQEIIEQKKERESIDITLCKRMLSISPRRETLNVRV